MSDIQSKIRSLVAKSLHQNCYCHVALWKLYTLDNTRKCGSCLKELIPGKIPHFYQCVSLQCYYRKTALQPFGVCEECFNRDDEEDTKITDLEQSRFIYEKFKSILKITQNTIHQLSSISDQRRYVDRAFEQHYLFWILESLVQQSYNHAMSSPAFFLKYDI